MLGGVISWTFEAEGTMVATAVFAEDQAVPETALEVERDNVQCPRKV